MTVPRFPVLPALAAGVAMLLGGCAGQVPPAGGPPDVTPPTVVRTIPDTNAVHVQSRTMEFEFDKYVDRRSVEESFFVSPYPGVLEFAWSGRTVQVTMPDSLHAGRTYVVTIGTDVVDLRVPPNHMQSGFALAFATGDSLDHGSIAGRVVGEKLEGTMVYAYQLFGMDADTLDPGHLKPDYLMQTGADGRFLLTHLGWGRYRVMAVRDEYRDLKYDRQVDGYGVWRRDLTLSPDTPAVSDVWFRMGKEDTTRPFLSGAKFLAPRRISVRFSEALDSAGSAQGSFSLLDTADRHTIPVAFWYANAAQSTEMGIVTAVSLDSSHAYWVDARGFKDPAGNLLDTLHARAEFDATGFADTVLPKLISAIGDSAKDVKVDAPLSFTVTRPVMPGPVVHAVSVLDSARQAVAASVRWRGLELLVTPRQELKELAWYTVRVFLDSLRSVYGVKAYKDSILTVRFRTQDLRAMGTIGGELNTAWPMKGPFVVTASRVDPSPVVRRSIVVARPGPFTVTRLPEGRYAIDAYEVTDSTGAYQFGLPAPFRPSAPFGVSSDTVKVRARWGVQGVGILVR